MTNGVYELAIDVPDHMVGEGVNRFVFTSDNEHLQIERLLELALVTLTQRAEELRNLRPAPRKGSGRIEAPDILGSVGVDNLPVYDEDLVAMIKAAEERLAAAWDVRAVFASKSLVHVRRPAEDEVEEDS